MKSLKRALKTIFSIKWVYDLPIRFKIMLIVGSGIGGFAVFLLINYMVTTSNSQRLHHASSVYFPVLEALNSIPNRMIGLNESLKVVSETRSTIEISNLNKITSEVLGDIKLVQKQDTVNILRANRLQSKFDEFKTDLETYEEMLTSGDTPEKLEAASKKVEESQKTFNTTTRAYRDFAYNEFTSLIAISDQHSKEMLSLGLAICLFVFMVLGISGYVVQSLITTSVREVNETLEEMVSGQGDLTKRLQSKGDDEIGDLVYWFNAFVARLDSIVGDAVTASTHVNDISSQMSNFNGTLLKRAENLKSELKDASNAVKLMLITVGKNEVDASDTDSIAAHAAESAQAGREVMAELNKAIGEISVSSERINDMVSAIDGIAFQTNLLALNAAVEAARAGEHGRGFAVVAGEVRELAQRAGTAAKEIKQVIKESNNKVYAGVRLADESNLALEELYEAARKAAELNSRIAHSSGEQSTDIENIAKVMNEVDRLTQESNIDIIESTQASKVLANQASRLAKLMKFFRVSKEIDSGHAHDEAGSTNSGLPSADIYHLQRKFG